MSESHRERISGSTLGVVSAMRVPVRLAPIVLGRGSGSRQAHHQLGLLGAPAVEIA